MMAAGTLLAALAATGALILAGFLLMRRQGLSFAEAGAYAIIATLMTLSFLYQLTFLLGMALLWRAVEVIITLAAIFYILQHRRQLSRHLRILLNVARGYPAAAWSAAAALGYLALQALLLPPDVAHWEQLTRVVGWQQAGRAAFAGIDQPGAHGDIGFFPFNALILPHMMLRFHVDWGVGLFGLLAYGAIGLATYALSRRYAWPEAAVTVTMVVMALPRLVLQATSPGQEIIPAAALVVSLLAVYRAVEQPNAGDLAFGALSAAFALTEVPISPALPAVLVLLAAVLLFRRQSIAGWWWLLKRYGLRWLLIGPPLLLFTRLWCWLIPASGRSGLDEAGAVNAFVFNPDGLQGGLANLGRYFLENVHLTWPVEQFCRWTFGLSIESVLESAHQRLIWPLFAQKGAVHPFAVSWLPEEMSSWFGPLGFALVLPALLYGLWRGPRRLKATALAIIGYVYLIALIPAWSTANVKYFTPLYACSGVFIAFFLPPWRLTRRGRWVIQTIALVLLFNTSLFNLARPLLPPRITSLDAEHPAAKRLRPYTRNIWLQTGWGQKRGSVASAFFGDERAAEFHRLVPANATVGVLAPELAPMYPFLLTRPRVRALPFLNHSGIIPAEAALDRPLSHLLLPAGSPLGAREHFDLVHKWPVSSRVAEWPGILLHKKKAGLRPTS